MKETPCIYIYFIMELICKILLFSSLFILFLLYCDGPRRSYMLSEISLLWAHRHLNPSKTMLRKVCPQKRGAPDINQRFKLCNWQSPTWRNSDLPKKTNDIPLPNTLTLVKETCLNSLIPSLITCFKSCFGFF